MEQRGHFGLCFEYFGFISDPEEFEKTDVFRAKGVFSERAALDDKMSCLAFQLVLSCLTAEHLHQKSCHFANVIHLSHGCHFPHPTLVLVILTMHQLHQSER